MHRRPFRALLPLILFAASLAGAGGAAASEFNAVWQAADGALPDSACPKWTAAASGTVPALQGGALRIQTSQCSQSASYWHSGPDFAMPDTFVVEARLRVTSYTECVGPCGHYRTGANLSVTTAPNLGVLCHIGTGEAFLTTSQCGGTVSAAMPTTDAMHTYRLVIHGTAVQLYQDGVLKLTGSTYSSNPDHGPVPRVGWGEASSLAHGTSDWEWVKHNGHATGCASTGVSPEAPAAGAALALRAWPSPSAGVTRLSWTLARPAPVRVELFDSNGRRIRRLAEAEMGAGAHELTWDGRDERGRVVTPGAYLFRVEAAGIVAIQRVTKLR